VKKTFLENYAFYEIMWISGTAGQATEENTAYAINTPSGYVTVTALLLQRWLHEIGSM